MSRINWKRVAKIFRARWLFDTDNWWKGFEDGAGVGQQEGAAVAFGLMGMAEAIRETYTCRDCGSWEPGWGPHCHCENDE